MKNSAHFVKTISILKIDSNDHLISFDMKSLFTQVPVEDALVIMKERLQHNESLCEQTTMSVEQECSLTELCLKSAYFSHGDQFYEQTRGHSNGFTSL